MEQHYLQILIGNELVSSCVLVVVELRSRKLAMIEEVKTVAVYRNQGYGKRILEKAIAKAKELECDTVELCYNPNRNGDYGKRLYESCGFVEDGNIKTKIILNEENMKKTEKW